MADKYLNLAGTREIVKRLKQYTDSKEGLGAEMKSEVLVLDSEIDPSDEGGGGSYTLPVASSSALGGVMIGSGVTISSSGVISVISSQEVQSMIDTSLAAITNADEVSF